MTRRGFFSALAAVTATATMGDPERLLWVPGRKLISIPKPPRELSWDFEVTEGWGFFKVNELWQVDAAGNTTRLFVDRGDGKFRLADDSYWIGRPAPFVVVEASLEPIAASAW